mmetsp:Transcript_33976/g.97733  ORF Transcript_33976/g.97733 Transcript_33976/m.97733 type:complete len:256 (+) Transcript_33976:75-842(+)
MHSVVSSTARLPARAATFAVSWQPAALGRSSTQLSGMAIRATALQPTPLSLQRFQSTRLQMPVAPRSGLKGTVTDLLRAIASHTHAVVAALQEGDQEQGACKAGKMKALHESPAAEVLGDLGDADAEVRRAAVDELARRAPWPPSETGPEAGVVAALAACCEDHSWPVRLAAVRALRGKAVAGDRLAVAAVVGCLQDCRADVRAVALDGVALIARCGAIRAAGTAAACLENQNFGLRWRSDEHSAAAAALAERGL